MNELSIKEVVDNYEKIKQLIETHKELKVSVRSFCHIDFICALRAIVTGDRQPWDNLPESTRFKRKLKKKNITV